VRDWLTRASQNLSAAERLGWDLCDIAIYHCQQAAEKAVKGFLSCFDQPIERTHDVRFLLEQAGKIEPGFLSCLDAGERLTPYATAYRNPGVADQAELQELTEALTDARTI
jgi:HEPN domain-containing protein